jgi:CheY-like chemotaxis protein
VLLDFMMPVLDGPAMLRMMRSNPEHNDIPAIIMSSLPEPAVDEAVHGMYSGFIRKPFKLRIVIDMVDRVLKGARV